MALSCPEEDSLECAHVELMRLYSLVLKQTAALPYLKAAGVPSDLCEQVPRTPELRGLLALMAVLFGGVLLPSSFLAMLSNLQAHLPAPLGADLQSPGMKLFPYLMYILLTLVGLNFWLLDSTAADIIAPCDSSALSIRRLIQPTVQRVSAYLIREHIRSQLETVLCLYRARIAARLTLAEEKTTLMELAEEAGKLKDSLPPMAST